jgi:predicted dehydrogenase
VADNVSASRLLGGEPERVWGEAWYGPTGTDWVFAATMRLPGDVIASFDCGTALPNRDELEAIGSEGSLYLDDPWHCNHPVIEVRRDGATELLEVEKHRSAPLGAGGRCRTGACARCAARVSDVLTLSDRPARGAGARRCRA